MYKHDDGGRSAAGMKGKCDCGIRAVAIACQLSYLDARKLLKDYASTGKQGNRAVARGIYKDDMDAALRSLGWRWQPAPKLSGRKARYFDLPQGRLIARMARHYAAVIDGVLRDDWDSSNKMVYGYWAQNKE